MVIPPLHSVERGLGGEVLSFHHLILIGLSGGGKSTIGPLLAAELDRPFLDTDSLIVESAGRTIPEIFATDGEAAFRALERAAVERALSGPPAVIATGGGAPVDPQSRSRLWQGNLVIWLDAPVETLAARLGNGGAGRPLLATGGPAARLRTLLDQRKPIYAEAHVKLETHSLSPEAAVRTLVQRIQQEDP